MIMGFNNDVAKYNIMGLRIAAAKIIILRRR